MDSKGPVELYRIDQDSLETKNVLASQPEIARTLYRTFLRIRKEELETKTHLAADREGVTPPTLPLDTLEELRALGYAN